MSLDLRWIFERENREKKNLATRDSRWKQIADAGGGNVSDFIAADSPSPASPLKTPIPENWNITLTPVTQKFQAEPFSLIEKFKYYFLFGGYVQWFQDKEIVLSTFKRDRAKLGLGKPDPSSSLLTHEFTHIMQHHEQASGWTSFQDDNPFEYWAYSSDDKLVQIEHNLRHFLLDNALITKLGAGMKSYFSRNVEIQARMNEALMCGYASWNGRPSNKTELWAALYNLGFDPPIMVRDHLQMTEEGIAALRKFSAGETVRKAAKNPVGALNSVHDHLIDENAKAALWEKIYPLMYGNLLEFYGDVSGRARMGLGSNPRSAIDLLHTIKDDPQSITRENAAALVEHIPADLSHNFLNVLVSRYPEDHPAIEQTMIICEFLLDRKDVKDFLFNIRETNTYTGLTPFLPLRSALNLGHARMAAMLVHAGADPFHCYEVKNILGNTLYEDCPISIAGMIENLDKQIAKPCAPAKKIEDPISEMRLKDELEDDKKGIQRALKAIAAVYPFPDRVVEAPVFGEFQKTTFRTVLRQIGIEIENAPQPVHEPRHL